MKENTKNPRLGVRYLCVAAGIAALYVVLTFFTNQLGLASGIIQLRVSEALTVLPYFTAAAIPGVTLGCLLANFLTGACALDIVLGPIATLLGALGARLLRRKPLLVPLPTVLANAFMIPWILRYGYGLPDAIWFSTLTVGAGELLSAGVLGLTLLFALKKRGGARLFS